MIVAVSLRASATRPTALRAGRLIFTHDCRGCPADIRDPADRAPRRSPNRYIIRAPHVKTLETECCAANRKNARNEELQA